MDYRTYLSLEASFTRRLQQAWAKKSTPIYTALVQAVEKGDFSRARLLVADLDMGDVGTENLEFIKFMLLSCGVCGAQRASEGQPTLVGASLHGPVIDQIASNLLQYLDTTATSDLQTHALQLIADAEAKATTKADKEGRYVTPFQSFSKPGMDKLQLSASLNSSRLSTWGFVAEAEARGITDYKLWNPDDGRTSKFCHAINGKTFRVTDAKTKVNQVLQVQNPDDLKTVQPFPPQDDDSIEAFRKMSPEELADLGLMIPPFHPLCRTLCVVLSKDKGKPPLIPVTTVVPKSSASQDSFAELGIHLSPEDVDYWNAHVGVSPVNYLAAHVGKLRGQEEPKGDPGHESPEQMEAEDEKEEEEVDSAEIPLIESTEELAALYPLRASGTAAEDLGLFDGQYRKVIEREQDGIRAEVLQAGESPSSVSTFYDPYTGNMYLDQADLGGPDLEQQAEFLANVLDDLVDVGGTMQASTFILKAGVGQAPGYIQMGMLPSPVAWQTLRMDALDDLRVETSPLAQAFSTLQDYQQELLTLLLQDNDEHAVTVLANLPWVDTYGRTFLELVLGSFTGNMTLDMNDPNAVEAFKEYLDVAGY